MSNNSDRGWNIQYGKHKGIFMLVALFIFVSVSVMIFNFYASSVVARDVVEINLAGRQLMLTQRMTKSLYTLSAEQPDSEAFLDAVKELKNSESLFNETLIAFANGGEAHSANQESIALHSVADKSTQDILSTATETWLPVKSTITGVLEDIQTQSAYSEDLTWALAFAKSRNVALLGQMDELVNKLEAAASVKASNLRYIQTAGITLAIMNFLFILQLLMRQLRNSDVVLENAHKETTDILQNVKESLYLVGENSEKRQEYSSQLTEMLKRRALRNGDYNLQERA